MPAPNELPEAVLPELPALPPRASAHAIVVAGNPIMEKRDLYTAEQMHAYARAYGEQCRAAGDGREADARRYQYARRFLSVHMIRNTVTWYGNSDSPEYMAAVDAALDTAMGAGQEGRDEG